MNAGPTCMSAAEARIARHAHARRNSARWTLGKTFVEVWYLIRMLIGAQYHRAGHAEALNDVAAWIC